MGINNKSISAEIRLRQQAEEQLKTKTSGVEFIRKKGETQRLPHELEVLRVELEMQNAELRQSRDKAERSLEKYTDLYEFTPVGYFTLDRNGAINAVNLRGASLVDIARPRLLGRRFVLFVSDEYRIDFNDFLDKVFLNQDKTVCEIALREKGNIPLYVQLEAMATISGQECLLALIDITGRKRLEELLLQSEQRYRTVVEDQTELICRFKADGTFTFVNDVYCRIFGKSKDELLGSRWAPNVFSDDVANIETQLRTMSPENPVVVIENRIHTVSGKILWMQFVNRGFYNSKGQLIETQAVGRDITDRKLAEEEMRSYASRLIVMEEELRVKLAAELHDEICRDLTVLGMNMTIISDAMTDVAPKKLISRIKDSGRLIKGISHTVRNIMVGLRPPTLDDFGLLAALRWHADLFSKRTGVEVSVQADDPFPRLMIEKETALFRISQEALMNVAKHATTQNVTIKLRKTDNMIMFDVVDKGKGLLYSKSSFNQTGFGWGMKIMRERAELMGGFFNVDTTPGKGTTISVALPIEDL